MARDSLAKSWLRPYLRYGVPPCNDGFRLLKIFSISLKMRLTKSVVRSLLVIPIWIVQRLLCCQVLNAGTVARIAPDIFGGSNVQGPPVRPISDPALRALVPGLQSSLRDLEEMMAERGIVVDHTTIHRWTVR